MDNIDITAIQLNWLVDILARIDQVINSSSYSSDQKLEAIKWLVKQTRLDYED